MYHLYILLTIVMKIRQYFFLLLNRTNVDIIQ